MFDSAHLMGELLLLWSRFNPLFTCIELTCKPSEGNLGVICFTRNMTAKLSTTTEFGSFFFCIVNRVKTCFVVVVLSFFSFGTDWLQEVLAAVAHKGRRRPNVWHVVRWPQSVGQKPFVTHFKYFPQEWERIQQEGGEMLQTNQLKVQGDDHRTLACHVSHPVIPAWNQNWKEMARQVEQEQCERAVREGWGLGERGHWEWSRISPPSQSFIVSGVFLRSILRTQGFIDPWEIK